MRAMASPMNAPDKHLRQEAPLPTQPHLPSKGLLSASRHERSPAAVEGARVIGRSSNAATPASAGDAFGHDFSRVPVRADERADMPHGVRLNVRQFSMDAPQHAASAAPRPDSARRPDKSVEPLTEFQDQGASVSSFAKTTQGVSITVGAEGTSPKKAHPDGYKFTQTIDTNVPLGGASSPYVDPRPNDDAKPFYWTDAEQAANPTTFRDAPGRPAPAVGTTNWDAVLALNGVNEATKTVTAYDALTYGFSRDSVGTVTKHEPKSTRTGEHRRILGSEFPGWTFTWGLTRAEKAGIGALGGAAVGGVIGGLVGGPIGGLIGAGIGALAGGLGSLLF